MGLAAGKKLGPYEVIAPLGSGGMGEVYRARDTRLGREVAIKVLPAERLADAARRARFVQEAQAASALNHPNIVTIHEIESAGGADFIVMELVAGKTLDALIPRQGMRLGEALRIAIPLADALAAAHAAGIVHRDLKPANVMVTPVGVVKVLDFGLAKLMQTEEGGGEEDTTLDAHVSPPSRDGTVAGTPAYMSPEQASGGKVDARSDVFAFGAVLYEMVTGQRAFTGSSSAETLAAVLKEQPKPPSEIALDVPRDLERIILHCLRKERERRFQHMADLEVELQEVKEESDSHASAPAGAATAKRRSRLRRIALVAAGVLILATAAGLTLWRLRRGEPPALRVVVLTSSRSTDCGSFSPDGTQVAFGSAGERWDNWDIWLKIVGEAETRRLTSDPAADRCPAWSPDGKQIAFVRSAPGAPAGAIYLVSPLGGPERRLSEFPVGARQVSWSPDGRWLATARARAEGEATPESGGIHLMPAGGGASRPLTFPRPPAWDACPAFSPDSRTLAYASCEPTGTGMAVCDLHVLALDSDLRPRGAPRRLTAQRIGPGGVAWTHDGRSILYGGAVVDISYLWRVRADGSSPPERVELAGPKAISPFTMTSGDRVGFIRSSWNINIHRLQVGATAATPLITSTAWDFQPQYSPDGRRIAFDSEREGGTHDVWLADADGSNPTRLTHGSGRLQGSPGWSPDGRTISFDAQAEDGHFDVWTIGVDGSGLRQMTHRATDHGPSSWSRDGRWIYFNSKRTGRYEVWRVAADGRAEEQVTRKGGFLPFESRDGRTLYYKRAMGDSPLLAKPTTGGEEQPVVGCVPADFGYALGPEGVFHFDCEPAGTESPLQRALRHWDARTGRDRLIATLDTGPRRPLGMAVSPDGHSVLFTHSTPAFDLMMIENFR